MAQLAEKVEQFCSITGANAETASHLLDACGGSIEAAIDLHMQSSSGRPSTTQRQQPTPQTSSASNTPPEQIDDDDDEVREPILPTSGVLMPHSYNQAHRAMHGSQRRANGSSVFESGRDAEAESSWFWPDIHDFAVAELKRQRALIRGDTSAASREESKKRDLQALFRPPVDMIAVGSFDTVKQRAAGKQRFLLINVQDVTEFACQALNRDVWSVSMIKDIVMSNFEFWQTYTDAVDGARVVAYYKIVNTPFVAIIDPRTGELVKMVPTTDVGVVADTLTTFICDHPTLDMLDEHRSRSGKRAATGDAPEEESVTEIAPKRACPPPAAPAVVIDWETQLGTSETTLTLLLRLPSGARHQQAFPKDTPIECVRLWAGTHGMETDTYELTMNYPKRSFDDYDKKSTLDECQFGKQETVMAVKRHASEQANQ